MEDDNGMRLINLKYPGTCLDCGAELAEGSKAKFYGRGRIYGVDCHEKGDRPNVQTALEAASLAAGKAYDTYVADNYTQPVWAVVDNAEGDFASDPDKPERVVDTMFDVCGFATVHVDNSRRNGAPGARLIAAFKAGGEAHSHSHLHLRRLVDDPQWTITTPTATFRLHKSSYNGVGAIGGPWSITGGYVGYGNGAMAAAGASANAFCETLESKGYGGLSVSTRID